MSGLLYYIPGLRQKPDAAALTGAGLRHLAGAELNWRGCDNRGPDGGAGMTLAPASSCNGRPVMIDLEAQRWRPWPVTEPTYYLGSWIDGRPSPGDLARPAQHFGHPVTLADGAVYRVPALRFLPRTMHLTAAGQIEYEAKEEHAHLAGQIQRAWRDFEAANQEPPPAGHDWLPVPEQFQLGADLLGLNYYLAPGEVDLLGLFDDETLTATIQAGMDIPAFLQLAREEVGRATNKKKDPAPD